MVLVLAAAHHVQRVLLSSPDRHPVRSGYRLPETAPLCSGALIEWRRLQVAPAVGGVIRVLVEDQTACRSDITGFQCARRMPDAHFSRAAIGPQMIGNQL